jgi:hypothetical protein
VEKFASRGEENRFNGEKREYELPLSTLQEHAAPAPWNFDPGMTKVRK